MICSYDFSNLCPVGYVINSEKFIIFPDFEPGLIKSTLVFKIKCEWNGPSVLSHYTLHNIISYLVEEETTGRRETPLPLSLVVVGTYHQ